MKRLESPVIVVAFALAAPALGKLGLRGDALGEMPTLSHTMSSLLMLLLLTGFGATSLTMVTIADDMSHVRSEYLQGATAVDQVFARLLSRLPLAVVIGVLAAVVYALVTEPAQEPSLPEMLGYLSVMPVYAASCTAFGVLISTLGSTVKSVVAWVVAILGGLVIAADLAMRIDGMPVVEPLAYLFPSRYAAGFIGANIGLTELLPAGESRGWTWSGGKTLGINVAVLGGSVLIYTAAACAVTAAQVRRWRTRG
jgi:hypothetical protein